MELTRDTQGVLVVEFHSNRGPLTFTAQEDAGLPTHLDPERGFDHGTYSLLAVTHAEAKIPVLQVSIRSDYDPESHLWLGRALAPLRL